MKKLEEFIYSIPDFPKPGILFRDVTGVLESGEGLRLATDGLSAFLNTDEFDLVAGMESRGFLFSAPIAYKFGKGLIPIRKPGKLPRKTISEDYDLEYGKATLHIHADSIKPGQRVVIIDDLLATGGTAAAAVKLVERLGGKVVKILFLIELFDLGGRARLSGYDVESVVKFPGH